MKQIMDRIKETLDFDIKKLHGTKASYSRLLDVKRHIGKTIPEILYHERGSWGSDIPSEKEYRENESVRYLLNFIDKVLEVLSIKCREGTEELQETAIRLLGQEIAHDLLNKKKGE